MGLRNRRGSHKSDDGDGGQQGLNVLVHDRPRFQFIVVIATLTVTMLQNGNITPLCGVGPGMGSIVLTNSSQDFILSATSTGGSVAYRQDLPTKVTRFAISSKSEMVIFISQV
jgi:hypothetical protein